MSKNDRRVRVKCSQRAVTLLVQKYRLEHHILKVWAEQEAVRQGRVSTKDQRYQWAAWALKRAHLEEYEAFLRAELAHWGMEPLYPRR